MKLLDHLKVDYKDNNDNIKTECVHCGSDSLSISSEAPHQYQCFKCKHTGNAFTYLRKWYDNLPPLTKKQATNLCDLKTGIKPIPLREIGIRYYNDCYWFPVYNNKDHLVALHKYVIETNIWYSSPKPTSLTILGLQNLSSSDTVWVAEGHWDFLTLLPFMVDTGIDLIATCGSYFSSNQLINLKNRHIVLLYDNDKAGEDGVDYVARNIKSNSIPIHSLSYLNWDRITLPNTELTKGFDIRDLSNAFSN